jgi:hypothetical protein
MASRGSKLQRAVDFFREGSLDEVRVAFQLVKEVVDERLAQAKRTGMGQAKAASTPRKKRRTRAEIQAAQNPPAGHVGHQTTIEEQAGTVTV